MGFAFSARSLQSTHPLRHTTVLRNSSVVQVRDPGLPCSIISNLAQSGQSFDLSSGGVKNPESLLLTAMSGHIKRRVQRSPSPQFRIENDGDYEPYIPVAQRRQAKLAKLSAWGTSTSTTRDDAREARRVEEEREDEEQEEERRREKVRRGRALLVEAQEVHSKKASEGVWLLHCT